MPLLLPLGTAAHRAAVRPAGEPGRHDARDARRLVLGGRQVSRSIFITGASSGIGEALAVEFARRGYYVAIAARRADRLEALAGRLRAAGAGRVLAVSLDVTDFGGIAGALRRAATEFGRLDVVVVNAGVGYSLPIGRGKFDLVRRTIDTDLTGAIATVEQALPILRAQGGGQVVAITSIAGVRGMPFLGAYSAAKAGLHRYLQSLRTEVAHEPIAVTELAPGYIDTDLNRDVASRPFVIPVEQGAAVMANLIERKVRHRYVPAWPWTLVAPVLGILPTRLLAPRRRRNT
ncbi:MAG: SDR family NAD(P)-dependent oxidoreductase [Gammaproteobacteria bacterium]|nr:SDR family NAD(P)-dependent oxidoreductase [Gammaproteobacteria bacterium]